MNNPLDFSGKVGLVWERKIKSLDQVAEGTAQWTSAALLRRRSVRNHGALLCLPGPRTS
jgi:hypothetical protein